MRKLLWLYFFLFAAGKAAGQEYVIDLKHWGMDEGLSYRDIGAMLQDRQGFIWLGTTNGLNRFDGSGFTWYTVEHDSLLLRSFYWLLEDADGNLWASGSSDSRPGGNFMIFNPGTRKSIQAQALDKDLAGESSDYGIGTLPDSSIMLVRPGNGGYCTWHPRSGLRRYEVQGGYRLQYAQPEQGTYVAQNDSNQLRLVDIASGKVLRQVQLPVHWPGWMKRHSAHGNYFINDSAGIINYVSDDLTISDASGSLPARDANQPEYVFNTGIDGIAYRQGKLYHPKYGILRDFVKEGVSELKKTPVDVKEDKTHAGRFWMSSQFGLYMLTISRNKFKQYFKKDSSYANSYRGIVVAGHNLYAANEADGIFKASLDTREVTELYSRVYGPASFFGMAKTANGGITMSNGMRLALPSEKVTQGADIAWWWHYEYAPGRALAGIFRGLVWMDGDSSRPFTGYNNYTELANAWVLYIAPGREGILWVCSNSGFYELDTLRGVIGRYSASDTGSHYLPSNAFQHFWQDRDGIYWLATTNGLVRWDKAHNKYRLYTRTEGLSNNNIYAVYEDAYNRLWMSSDYGIMEFDKATGAVKAYLVQDGISCNEFNRISHYQDTDGTIYFGSLNGVTAFNPKDFVNTGTENSARIAITSFQQFNGATNKLEDKMGDLLKTNLINIYPADRFFNLEFALLNYADPGHTSYYWKIDGIDTGWNSQKERTLRFSRLPYGEHILHIKAQGANGAWSRNQLAISLHVVAPLYLRPWFLMLAVMAAVLMVLGGYRWRLYLLRKENERLEKKVLIKTEDLRLSLHQKEILLKEIHHRVKNNLQVISSLLRLQSNSSKDEAAKNILLEGQNRVLSIALIHQKLYQDEKLDRVEMSTFADELFTQLKSVFAKPGISTQLINEMPEVWLGVDTAVPLGLILNELITNSFKYAFVQDAENSITITFAENGTTYTLAYSDSGPGLPEGMDIERSKSLGLRLINSLSRQIEGNASYSKENGNQFLVTFSEGE